jgi:hypothetical protein
VCQPVTELMELPDGVKISYDERFRFELVSDAPVIPEFAKDMLEDDVILHNAFSRGGE